MLYENNEANKFREKAFSIIKSNIEEAISSSVTIDTELFTADIDSIAFIKIVVSLEEVFNFEFDDEKLLITAFPKINDMINYVDLKVNEQTRKGEDAIEVGQR